SFPDRGIVAEAGHMCRIDADQHHLRELCRFVVPRSDHPIPGTVYEENGQVDLRGGFSTDITTIIHTHRRFAVIAVPRWQLTVCAVHYIHLFARSETHLPHHVTAVQGSDQAVPTDVERDRFIHEIASVSDSQQFTGFRAPAGLVV